VPGEPIQGGRDDGSVRYPGKLPKRTRVGDVITVDVCGFRYFVPAVPSRAGSRLLLAEFALISGPNRADPGHIARAELDGLWPFHGGHDQILLMMPANIRVGGTNGTGRNGRAAALA